MGLWSKIGLYTGLGFVLPAGALAGFGIGWLIDRAAHTSNVFAIVLGLAGGAGGLIEILHVLNREEK
jgi:F0F1-type ATP synthase assembly protein I